MSQDKMEKVSQRDCCCSGGGVAWGRDCRKCPDFSTGVVLSPVILGGEHSLTSIEHFLFED